MNEGTTPAAVTLRDDLVSHVRQQLFGPTFGDQEELPRNDAPHKRYLVGVLFPREMNGTGDRIVEVDEELGVPVGGEDQPDDSPLAAMLQRAPASAGMTFAVAAGSSIEIEVSASLYDLVSVDDENSGNRLRHYLRVPLSPEKLTHSDSGNLQQKWFIFDGRGEVRLRWREIGNRRVVTVSLINTREVPADDRIMSEDCLFQVTLRVHCCEGEFMQPSPPPPAFDEEEEELRLRYRKRRHWAVGHGTSVNWSTKSGDSTPDWVEIDYLPQADVHPFDGGLRKDSTHDDEILKPEFLAGVESGAVLKIALTAFIDDFTAWCDQCEKTVVDPDHDVAFERVIQKLRGQEGRLRHGIEVLCDPTAPELLEAFRLANEAMLSQMEATHRKRGRSFDPTSISWYPFQLAFQLLTIPGISAEGEPSGRDLVDLLWFPTGGGKTEAYLLLAAFTIILRRLRHGEDGCGTAVLSRYTLRLLTAQQFERTATLICALEKMRRDSKFPGEDPVTIGLWIGGGETSSPNTLRQAKKLHDSMLEDERPRNNFMLRDCPWCGTRLVPDHRSEDTSDYGIEVSASHMRFFCTSDDCEFSDQIPVHVVDEVIYDQPPTVLLATIDKFARLPWDGRSRSFLGLDRGSRRPPDLVIQDELHLISGPLGTIAAIYEAGIDVLLEHSGHRPKIIAATATIRGARDQTRRLYGREVRLFPCSGIDAEDSYFMREDRPADGDDENPAGDRQARRYLGIMGQGHTPVTGTVRLMAVLLDGGGRVSAGDEFWTLVAYHNSRRELGKSQTLARDDVPARIQQIATPDPPRECHQVEGLSGETPSWQIPEILSDLELDRSSGKAIDVLACTSMISVGVDVARLNQMMIIGQPKTAGEYIQASSRVGRARAGAGLVAVQFSSTKPRDRSHYESFRHYHESIYRWVEPTSVTPQAEPALERALHATVILVIRLALLHEQDQANAFDVADPVTRQLLSRLEERLGDAVGDEARETVKDKVQEVSEWWSQAATDSLQDSTILRYQAETQFPGLLKFFGSMYKLPARETLNSMRHVDGEVETFITGDGGGR